MSNQSRIRVSLLALTAAAALAACGRTPPAPTPAPAAPPAAAKPVMHDGTPRLVDSTAGGVHIQYRVYGHGQPLVVLVHGWSCDSNYWAAQIKPLAAKYTVMTVDLAGHGASGANRKDWSIGAFGADVASAVDAMPDAGKVIIVGHSLGGPVAIEAARKIGARVLGVVGVDSYQTTGLPPPPAAELKKSLAAFEKDFIGTARNFVTTSFFRKDADPAFVRRVADDMSQAPPEVAVGALRTYYDWDPVAAMRSLASPIVAINSDLHGVTDEARIRKLVPNFHLVTIPGTGHFLMMEHPEKFNPALLDELRKIAGTGDR